MARLHRIESILINLNYFINPTVMYLLKTGSLHHNLDVCQRTVAMTNLKKKEEKKGVLKGSHCFK